ncbi:MAG TPA: M42 family metallopeptidase, partial [Clostridia bacterium]|nr:M42 family metallopeptidase [Clostridia bacterium]
LVIEGTICQDTPKTKPHEAITRLGEGPVLTFMDRTSVADRRILEELRRIAEKKGIKVQYKEGTAGGNDAGAIHLTRAGVPTATVSVPCRYIHSPVSVASISDIEDTLSLVEGFLRSVARGFYP